eukprot:2305893-Rhodomonas_salina.4
MPPPLSGCPQIQVARHLPRRLSAPSCYNLKLSITGTGTGVKWLGTGAAALAHWQSGTDLPAQLIGSLRFH